MQTPLGNVFALILYLVPGFVALRTYRARYPVTRATDLETLIWSLVHTFVIHLGLVGLSGALDRPSLNLLSRLPASKEFATVDGTVVAALLVSGFIWGLILITIHWLRRTLPFLPTPDQQSVWPVIASLAPRRQLWALIRLKEGPIYLGWIDTFTFNPDHSDHDFYLKPAFRVDETMTVRQDLSEGGVYLNTRDVQSLELVPGAHQ
jgi:hypothetical protein